MTWCLYIKTSQGLRRFPQTWVSRSYPQFANTRQAILSVVWDDGRLWKMQGSFVQFKADGTWDREHSNSATFDLLIGSDEMKRIRQTQVPDLVSYREAEQLKEQHRWQPSSAEQQAIALDTIATKRRPIPLWRADERKP